MSSRHRKPPKRLFKTDDRVSRFAHERSPIGKMKRMAREHESVLHGIEGTLISSWEADPSVDDAVVGIAIHAVLTKQMPDDPSAVALAAELTVERVRHDVTDLIWGEALRIVRDSLHRHSQLLPGEREYLRFVAGFVD